MQAHTTVGRTPTRIRPAVISGYTKRTDTRQAELGGAV